MSKLRGLFLNTWKAECSIYESGKMAYNALILSDKYHLDYQEINAENRKISINYNFFIFNYHQITMGWLDTTCVKNLPGLKATIVLEVLPQDPFVMCPRHDFDAYIVLDPTINLPYKNVYAFPRPLEKPPALEPYIESDIPTIGSFGFPTSGKGFELVVEAVNKEFEKAIVKLNIPFGTYAHPEGQEKAKQMGQAAKAVAKPGIEVIVTHDYMEKDDLIRWCAKNTLNCFLYNRNLPGLAATTDQAIVSGRPLAVSANETFRHIHKYIKPYPELSLRESINFSVKSINQMQMDWSQQSFANVFVNLLDKHQKELKSISQSHFSSLFTLKIKQSDNFVDKFRSVIRLRSRLKRLRKTYLSFVNNLNKVNINSREFKLLTGSYIGKSKKRYNNETVLFVNHSKQQCGIHQYGVNLSETLVKSKKFDVVYAECDSALELKEKFNTFKPSIIIFNYYKSTMPWLRREDTRIGGALAFGVFHEVTQQEADSMDTTMFDFHLCPDPTLVENNVSIRRIKRLIPPYSTQKSVPENLVIGSFGFGFGDKGFERLIDLVQEEFDDAEIRIQMPFNDIVDPDGAAFARETAQRCRSRIRKNGIKLKISHKFLSHKGILDFLASNTINVFLYDVNKDKGISSVIDYALAVKRPICINQCGMFRHIRDAEPTICIEKSNIKNIISNGTKPLLTFYREWNETAFLAHFEGVIEDARKSCKKN